MRNSPPFRADHVGSLLRPAALLQARDDFAAGRITADALREVEDEAIREVVRDAAGGRACSRRPTGSSAGPPGTWTSSTGSAASARPPRAASRSSFHNEQGDLEFTPAAMRVHDKIRLDETDLRRRLHVPARHRRPRPCRS